MLPKQKKEIIYLISTFVVLCIASAYWQISKRIFPADAIRPVLIYSLYATLLAIWCVAIHSRVTQRNMRIYLTAENILMLFGMTIRFIQEMYWYRFTIDVLSINDILLMRFSGYCTNIAFILIPLFGFYASFGLTKTEEYRFNRIWHFLLVPAASLTLIVLTNDVHHFVYKLTYDETRSTLYYHPNIGFNILIGWTFSLLLLRIFMIYRRSLYPGWFMTKEEKNDSRRINGTRLTKLVPLLFTVLIALANIPYIATSFVVEFELLEQEVTLFFLEILVWESCILVGMVPVNTHYDEVFDRSTIAMQIIDKDGRNYLRSHGAPIITPAMFNKLKEIKSVRTPEGIDIHIQPIHGGYSVWQNDVSQTIAVIEELCQSLEELEKDAVFIQNELAIKSEEVAIKEQNAIYNRLITDVGRQISLIRNNLDECCNASDKNLIFKKICSIGIYIKRRCHLRLVEQSDGAISNAELQLSFYEIINYLNDAGIKAEVLWHTTKNLSPEFAIYTLDVFEALLEQELLNIYAISIDFKTDATIFVQVKFCGDVPKKIPVVELQRLCNNHYNIKCHLINEGYQIIVASNLE